MPASLKLFPLLLLLILTAPARADFALRDNDTVVFLGDSITAEGTWGKVVETYTLLRYPDRKIHFINAGWGGDTAAGGLKRLDRDVFSHHPTVLLVVYGINDIGWGARADDAHKQIYLDSIRAILSQCKSRNIRVFICSAPVTAQDPDKSEKEFLQSMCDQGMALARDAGENSIDIQRAMRSIQRKIKEYNEKEKDEKKRETLHVPDGIHLNDLGETAMAYAVLKGLGAPADVSSVSYDIPTSKLDAQGCTITNLKSAPDHLEFDRLDQGLPLNFGLFGALKFRFIPIPENLNLYLLTITGLPDGNYNILANNRPLGVFSSSRLAQGLNLSSATADPWLPGGPWEAQAWLVNMLTDSRWHLMQTAKFDAEYLKDHPNAPSIITNRAAANTQIETLQRQIAQPAPYHFTITKSPDKK